MKKKSYDDDDGRTIVDMSSVERTPLFLPHLPKKKGERKLQEEFDTDDQNGDPRLRLTKKESRSVVFAATGAALLIAGIFAAAGALLIAFLILVWT